MRETCLLVSVIGCAYGTGTFFTISQFVFDLWVSGSNSFANPNAPGAAITLAAIK